MKRKYKNIIVPYIFFDKKKDDSYYIYNDKEYKELYKVLKDFIGSCLVYHFEVNDKLIEVYDMENVLEYIISDYDSFKIPTKYKKEYSEDEYKTINYVLDILKNKKEIKVDRERISYNGKKRLNKKERQWLSFLEEMKQYDNKIVPVKVHSKVYDIDVYTVNGEGFFNALSALDESTLCSFYYQFNGDGIEGGYDHNHEHFFNTVIDDMFRCDGIIKIYDFQKKFYSEQELKIIDLLNKKFEELNFNLPKKEYDNESFKKWEYYKDNKKYLRLLAFDIKEEIKDRKEKNDKLKRHKK